MFACPRFRLNMHLLSPNGGLNGTAGNEWLEMLAPCFVQITPELHTKSNIFTFFDRWLTMHICQTFIYRSIYS